MVFILIDDDPIANLIHRRIIEAAFDFPVKVITFLGAESALDYIEKTDIIKPDSYIFLDLNMPVINGWDFLDHLESQNSCWRNIFILSSSVAKSDLNKANTYRSVKGYLAKPLSIPAIQQIFQQQTIN